MEPYRRAGGRAGTGAVRSEQPGRAAQSFEYVRAGLTDQSFHYGQGGPTKVFNPGTTGRAGQGRVGQSRAEWAGMEGRAGGREGELDEQQVEGSLLRKVSFALRCPPLLRSTAATAVRRRRRYSY
ncbi:unnamed protein product [Calypogeia fissa]